MEMKPISKWLEIKIGRRKWGFTYTRWVKKRLKPKVRRLTATQYAIKTGKDTYDLIMKGRRY